MHGIRPVVLRLIVSSALAAAALFITAVACADPAIPYPGFFVIGGVDPLPSGLVDPKHLYVFGAPY